MQGDLDSSPLRAAEFRCLKYCLLGSRGHGAGGCSAPHAALIGLALATSDASVPA